MWRCLKCGGDVADSLQNCWSCGTSRDGIAGAGLPQAAAPAVATVVSEPTPRRPPRPQVGIPRRFGIGTMMILVAVFAVVFSVMKTLGAPPLVFGGIAVFFAGVGLFQVLLFKGRDPRRASVIGGLVMGLVVAIGVGVAGNIIYGGNGRRGPQDFGFGESIGVAVMFLLLGGPFGYLAGCVLAAMFLIRKEPDDGRPQELSPSEISEIPPLPSSLAEPPVDSVVDNGLCPPQPCFGHMLDSASHRSFRLSPPRGPQVGIPRRFGIGTMMILAAAFAVLFSAMKTLGLPPEGFAVIGGFFAGVALCQILLFRGRDPRKASVVGGIIMFGLISVVLTVVEGIQMNHCNIETIVSGLFSGGLASVFFGGPLGYLAGCLLAAVFLVRKEPEDDPPPEDPRADAHWKEVLMPEQYRVTRHKETEPPFSGAYWDCTTDGVYRCICCGAELFDSKTKFDAGCGWPSFFEPIDKEKVRESEDSSHRMIRTEVTCKNCGAHLGHVFDDGPQPTGLRYCINSASLKLEPRPSEGGAKSGPAEQ